MWFDPVTRVVTSITTLIPDQWYHVADTYDGSEARVYIDGGLDATGDESAVPLTNTSLLFFGQRGDDNSSLFFDGLLDEVSIYNRALTAEEISAIYAAGSHGKTRPEPPPLVEVIVDNEDPDFRIFSDGWALVNNNDAYNGTYHFHNPGTPDDWVTFSADLPEGNYEVYASWVAGANRATDAPYTIPPNRTTVRVNQTINGGRFNLLGTFDTLGGVVIVELTADGDGLVIADTVRFVQIEE